MVEPRKRSRSLRRIKKRTPKGEVKTFYKRRKSTHASCEICGKKLTGVSTDKKLSKTQKKPGRKYSGNLCHSCAERVIRLKARIKAGEMKIEEVEPKYRKFVEK